MRISSERGLLCLWPDQANEHVVQRWFGLVEAAQPNLVLEAKLKYRLRIGIFAQLEFPLARAIFVSLAIFFDVVDRKDISRLADKSDVVFGFDPNTTRENAFSFRDAAVKNLFPFCHQDDPVTQPFGV